MKTRSGDGAWADPTPRGKSQFSVPPNWTFSTFLIQNQWIQSQCRNEKSATCKRNQEPAQSAVQHLCPSYSAHSPRNYRGYPAQAQGSQEGKWNGKFKIVINTRTNREDNISAVQQNLFQKFIQDCGKFRDTGREVWLVMPGESVLHYFSVGKTNLILLFVGSKHEVLQKSVKKYCY